MIGRSYAIENKVRKVGDDNQRFILLLEIISNLQNEILCKRKDLKKQAGKIEAMDRYLVLKEYDKGDCFGELALLNDDPRAAAVNATRTTFFATVHKDDYEAHIKRFEEKEKKNIVTFFKQIPFMTHLSQ